MTAQIRLLLALCELYRLLAQTVEAKAISVRAVSVRVFDDTAKIETLHSGGGLEIGRFDRSMRWLAANWPHGCDIPPELTRGLTNPADLADAVEAKVKKVQAEAIA